MNRPFTAAIITSLIMARAMYPATPSPRRDAPAARGKGGAPVVDLSDWTPPSPGLSPEPPAYGPWGQMEVTAYSHGCTRPRGPEKAPQRAADGQWPVANWTVAAGPQYAFGTVLELSHAGVVTRRVVGDRGRAIKGRRLDLFVEDCERARRWGRKLVSVRVVREPMGGRDGE